MLKQQRADTALVHVVGDRQGDLRCPQPLVHYLIAGAADHLPVQHGQQPGMVRRRLAAYPLCLLLGRGPVDGEEAQVEVLPGHRGVHVPHRIEIAGPRRPDRDSGPVGQQGVATRPGVLTHVPPWYEGTFVLTPVCCFTSPGAPESGTMGPSPEGSSTFSSSQVWRPLSTSCATAYVMLSACHRL